MPKLQYYTYGDFCPPITNYRTSHVKILCDPNASQDIVVSETEGPTCNYEFVVYSASVWCASALNHARRSIASFLIAVRHSVTCFHGYMCAVAHLLHHHHFPSDPHRPHSLRMPPTLHRAHQVHRGETRMPCRNESELLSLIPLKMLGAQRARTALDLYLSLPPAVLLPLHPLTCLSRWIWGVDRLQQTPDAHVDTSPHLSLETCQWVDSRMCPLWASSAGEEGRVGR